MSSLLSHVGLLFNKASIWMGFRVSGKTFMMAPLMENHQTSNIKFQKMDISNPSSRFLLYDDITSFNLESSEEQRRVLYEKLNTFLLAHEQEIKQKLIKYWDDN